MEAPTLDRTEDVAASAASIGWISGGVGLAGVAWWVWTWSRVDALISDHVARWGPLPTSSTERAALYVDGTAAQRQLSDELAAVSGLYPWGVLPLLLFVPVALLGFVVTFAVRSNRPAAVVGMCATVLGAVWSIRLGSSVAIALEILE